MRTLEVSNHAVSISPPPVRRIGALAGLVSGVVALGIAELIASTTRTWRSPVLDVGDRVVDNVPVFLKEFAIEQFGTNDKPALLIGIGALLAVYSIMIGILAFSKRLGIGIAGIALFGVIGVVVAVTRRVDGSLASSTPALLGAATGMLAMWVIHRSVEPLRESHRAEALDSSVDVEPVDMELASATRRQMLFRSAGVVGGFALLGAGAGAAGRSFRARFDVAATRAGLRLPSATNALDPIPESVSVDVANMSSFVTSNADFYRIDTALTVPQVPLDTYSLRVTGMVDEVIELSFDELTSRNVVEHDITLTCVSNTVGGELIGNARWLGVRLDELLADAGVQPGATQVVGRSVDGYTCGFPIEAATDGRNALVAFGMNGEPLPAAHGFPVRLIVPGLYGYISATKWLTEIELTTFESFESYWVPRGYSDRAPIKLMSRIDSVDGLGTLTTGADGTAAIGGVAWAQTRGISGVEVQIDDGPWQPAELGDALNDDTWRQWAFRWEPAARDRARVSIRCRATDNDGRVQTAERADPLPNGASGHHQIIVFVE